VQSSSVVPEHLGHDFVYGLTPGVEALPVQAFHLQRAEQRLAAGVVWGQGQYCQHATHEPFHAEFKTDMGLERLPSGKFDTNYLVCQMACVAMNVLRLIGTHTLHGKHAPVRHAAQRPGASARSCRRGPTRPPA
jgi:hypothetical protein